jgi:uncharacterized protein
VSGDGGTMKINISSLSEGTHDYQLSKKSEEIGLGSNFFGGVQARVTLEKVRRQLFLKAKVSAQAHVECARCLDPMDRKFDSEFRIIYVQNEEEYQEGNEDEVRILQHDTNNIDISDDVKDFILLSIPLKLVCRDTCGGLCPRCGRKIETGHDASCTQEEIETDSRWNKLRDLIQ